MGVLNVYAARRYRYTRDNTYLLSMLASQAAIAIQNARTVQRSHSLEEQIHELDKLSVVGELAAGIAHEIRNPLSAVRMLIESWEAEDENEQEDLNVISTQLEGINRCVTQLLESARPRSPEFSSVCLAAEVANTLQMLRVRIRDQDIQALVDLPEDLLLVRADASRFRQLLMNLILNSLNAYTEPGNLYCQGRLATFREFNELPGTLVTKSERHSEHRDLTQVLFIFSDDAGGFSHTDIQQAFEPFHTRGAGGFGLGLSVVKRIAEEHEAALKVHNRPGEGVTYFVLFAVATPTPETG